MGIPPQLGVDAGDDKAGDGDATPYVNTVFFDPRLEPGPLSTPGPSFQSCSDYAPMSLGPSIVARLTKESISARTRLTLQHALQCGRARG